MLKKLFLLALIVSIGSTHTMNKTEKAKNFAIGMIKGLIGTSMAEITALFAFGTGVSYYFRNLPEVKNCNSNFLANGAQLAVAAGATACCFERPISLALSKSNNGDQEKGKWQLGGVAVGSLAIIAGTIAWMYGLAKDARNCTTC